MTQPCKQVTQELQAPLILRPVLHFLASIRLPVPVNTGHAACATSSYCPGPLIQPSCGTRQPPGSMQTMGHGQVSTENHSNKADWHKEGAASARRRHHNMAQRLHHKRQAWLLLLRVQTRALANCRPLQAGAGTCSAACAGDSQKHVQDMATASLVRAHATHAHVPACKEARATPC